jgi:hypothetical protein
VAVAAATGSFLAPNEPLLFTFAPKFVQYAVYLAAEHRPATE